MVQIEQVKQSEQTEQLLRPCEVASLIGVSVKTLRDWRDSGKLKVYKTAGGHLRVTMAEVQRIRGEPITDNVPDDRIKISYDELMADEPEQDNTEWTKNLRDLFGVEGDED